MHAKNHLAQYQKTYHQFCKENADGHLMLSAFDGFVRRSAQIHRPFMLKGSCVSRQYFANLADRIPMDLDFVYLKPMDLTQPDKIAKTITHWLQEVTTLTLDDGMNFQPFCDGQMLFNNIDYCMADDFPTISTEIVCFIENKRHPFDLDISFNLPMPIQPDKLLYKTPVDEFIVPYSVPLSLQIAWKMHQMMVRLRIKDIYDLAFLAEKIETQQQIDEILTTFVDECHHSNFNKKRIENFFNYSLLKNKGLKLNHHQPHFLHLNQIHGHTFKNMNQLCQYFMKNMQKAGLTKQAITNYL